MPVLILPKVKEDIQTYFNHVWHGHNENQALIENGESDEAGRIACPTRKALEWKPTPPSHQEGESRNQEKGVHSRNSNSSLIRIQPAAIDVGGAQPHELARECEQPAPTKSPSAQKRHPCAVTRGTHCQARGGERVGKSLSSDVQQRVTTDFLSG